MADYEIVKPKVDLRKKIKILPNSSGLDPVAKAEEAMQRLSVNFGNWMRAEVAKLQAAWTEIDQKNPDPEHIDKLFRCAHDIKGQAHTMGFPFAGQIAGSLCEMIDLIKEPENQPIDLFEKHVQAIIAVVNENARDQENAVGKALVSELNNRSEEIIEKYKFDNGIEDDD